MSSASRLGSQPSTVARGVILGVVGAVFAIPIIAMIQFTFRIGLGGDLTFEHWTGLVGEGAGRTYRGLFQAIGNSVVLAIVTVGIVWLLLLPTMILVQLQFPQFKRLLEFICIVPITVPAIVLVVGLAPVYGVVVKIFGSGAWTLAFAYGITVLPYAYRAIQSNLDAVPVGKKFDASSIKPPVIKIGTVGSDI